MYHHWRLSLCAAIALTMVLSISAAPWPGGRGPGNRGAFPTVAFPKAPGVVWKAFLGNDYVDVTPSNAIIAGDTIVVAYGKYLIGLSTDSGELRWEQLMPEMPIDDLLYLDNQVIVSYPIGSVIAYNPSDGSVAWKQQMPGGLRNNPVYTDTYFLYATKSHTIEAIARKKGDHLGTTDTQEKIDAAPVIFGRSLVIAYTEGNIKRVDENLINRWSYNIPDAIIAISPVTDGKTVLLSVSNTIYALNPNDRFAPVRWTYSMQERLSDPLTLDGNRVYFASHSGRLFALDLATGKDVDGWSSTTTSTVGGKQVVTKKAGLPLLAPAVGSPLVIGDSLLVRMESGLMALYDKTRGNLKWVYRLKPPTGATVPKTPVMGTPAIEGNVVVFAGSDGCIYRLDAGAPDTDAPSFENVLPQADEKGYLTTANLQYLGAVILDEGCGIFPSQVTMKLDATDLSKEMQFDAASGFYYYKVPATSKLRQGMHRLVMTARDARGNVGTLKKDFILVNATTSERLVVSIGGEFVPKHLVVHPGAVISWVNHSGSPRTVVADQNNYAIGMHLDSDELYPDGVANDEQWAWIVPQDLEPGTKIYYHCRIKGEPGDGDHLGKGLVGVIEVAAPTPTATTPYPGATTAPTMTPGR